MSAAQRSRFEAERLLDVGGPAYGGAPSMRCRGRAVPGYQKIPTHVHDLIERCSSNTFYVGKTTAFTTDALADGALEHLGATWNDSALQFESPFVPLPGNGRWSRYNVNGWVKVHYDQPKEDRTIGGWSTPNFGDWRKGSHVHYRTIKAHPRETWYGQRLPIIIDAHDSEDGNVTLGFRVDRVFDRTSYLERDLHMACSLLRENIHAHVSVVPTDLSVETWLANQRVNWEILPKGEATFEKVVTRLGVSTTSPRVREARGRYEAVQRMNPGATVVGEGEFSRYFGFKFREDLVALECLDYGNALYLMYEDWQDLSQRTRVDLLADPNAKYDRIVHRDGWQETLRALLTVHGHNVRG